MAKVDEYTVYKLKSVGTGTNQTFSTNGLLATNTSIIDDNTSVGSNTNILGDTVYDSFSVVGYDSDDTTGPGGDKLADAGGTNPLIYVGYVTVTTGGATYYGAVGEYVSGGVTSYFLFFKSGDPDSAFTSTTFSAANATFTPSVTNVPATEWLIKQEEPFCFLSDTMMLTPSGERAVETLRAGDLVLTAAGVAKPIRWIGRTVVASKFADRQRMMPVRISAGALAENVPSRDLLVSPGHAIEVGGLLVHAGALVNGTTIVREPSMPLTFTYHHVETDAHDLLVAENTPAESFLEAVADIRMDNFPERAGLAGQGATVEMDLPRVKSPRQVPMAIRRAIEARVTGSSGLRDVA